MIFTNSKGYEYQIRLVGVDEVDEITYENVRIDHPDRPDMTLEEYFAFAGAEAERPYFEYKELEILESLIEGCGLTITQEDLDSLPEEYAKDILGHYAYAGIFPGTGWPDEQGIYDMAVEYIAGMEWRYLSPDEVKESVIARIDDLIADLRTA